MKGNNIVTNSVSGRFSHLRTALLKSKRIYTSIVAVFFLLFVNGCATIQYVEPTSGERTRVRFVTNTTNVIVVRSYTSQTCEGEKEMMRLRKGFLLNSSPKRLGMPLWTYHENAAKEFYLLSEQEHHLMFFGSRQSAFMTYSCAVPISYTFQQGKEYELIFSFEPYNNCSVSLYEIKAETEENYQPVFLKKYLNQGNDECKKAFNKLRLF